MLKPDVMDPTTQFEVPPFSRVYVTIQSAQNNWKEELRKEIEDKFNAMRTMSLEDIMVRVVSRANQTLSTFCITSAPKPSRFSIAVFKVFDESRNPEEHVYQYIQKMSLEIDEGP